MLRSTREPFPSELRDTGSRLDLPRLNPNLMPMSRGLVLFFALIPMVLASAELERLNHVVAIVGETPITMGDIQTQTAPLERSIYQQYPNNPALRRQKVLEVKQQALETLVERQLILMEFDAQGYQLPEKIIDKQVQERIRDRFGDRLTLTRTLQAQGVTFEAFRKDIKTTVIVDFLTAQNVNSVSLVSPSEIKAYYDTHLEDFQQEKLIRLRMIFLKANPENRTAAEAMLKEIRAKVEAGTDFASLAKVYHQGSQRNQGGDWGWVDRNTLRSDLSEEAFKLEEGQASEIITTDEGCYLLYAQEIKPAEPKRLASVQSEIEAILLAEEKNRLRTNWIDELKKKNFVRYY